MNKTEETLFIVALFCFCMGNLCLALFNYDDDFVKPYIMSFDERNFHTGDFKIENGIFLDFHVLGSIMFLEMLTDKNKKKKKKECSIRIFRVLSRYLMIPYF